MDVFQQIESSKTFLSVETLAHLLDVSENLIRKQIRLRKLVCVRVGDLIRLNPSDIVAWLRARSSAR